MRSHVSAHSKHTPLQTQFIHALRHHARIATCKPLITACPLAQVATGGATLTADKSGGHDATHADFDPQTVRLNPHGHTHTHTHTHHASTLVHHARSIPSCIPLLHTRTVAMHMRTSACMACICKQVRCDSNSRSRLHTIPPPRFLLVCASVCHDMRSSKCWRLAYACMGPNDRASYARV
jgi:hypothetical protein